MFPNCDCKHTHQSRLVSEVNYHINTIQVHSSTTSHIQIELVYKSRLCYVSGNQ